MRCETAEELISALLDDELTAAERTRLEEHMRACRTCAEAQGWLQATKAAVRTIAHEQHALPPGFWPVLFRRLDAAEPHRGAERGGAEQRVTARAWLVRVPVRAAISIGMAVGVLCLALGIVWFTPMPAERTDARVSMAVLALDFEQQAAEVAPPWSHWEPFVSAAEPFAQDVKYATALMRPPDPGMTFVGHSTRYVNGVVAVQLTYSSGPHWIALYQLPAAQARLPTRARAASPGRQFHVVCAERCSVVACFGAAAACPP
jgi:anti-sigma factor RsiW